jgi:tetratricopeptide (TPR) repeat protein
MPDVSQLLPKAVQFHQAGQVEQAREIYLQILRQDANNLHALNLLGLAGWQTGRHAEAVEYLERAIAIDPKQAAFHGNLAEARRGLGQLGAAIESYAEAARLQPDAVIVHVNMGTLLQQADQPEHAITSYGRALELDPQNILARYHLGTAFEQQGKPQPAESCYEQVLESAPEHVPSLVALAALRKTRGDLPGAIELYERALRLEPEIAARHFDLGNVHQVAGRWSEAVACYRRALDINPQYAEAFSNLVNALRELNQLDEALICAERAVQLRPESAPSANNLAVVLQDLGRLDEARGQLERAILLDPKKAELRLNLGVVLKDQGLLDQAIAKYDEALTIQPDHAHARCSRGMALLSLGRFAEGWQGYEHRIGLPQFDTLTFPEPRWDGTPLSGRTLLIHCEQGFGDTLQFIRFVKPAVERAGAGKIVVAAQPELIPLLSQSGYLGLTSKEQPLPEFDVHVPLMSLPLTLGVEMDSLARDIPYLSVEPTRIDKWRQELGKYPGFKIGIGWQGRPDFRGDRLRSIPLETFAPLADVPRVRLISLQKGPGSEQLGAGLHHFDVVDLGDALDGRSSRFMDSAAVMQGLDLVVTSDSALAHLAGALGVRVWLALSAAPDWRWMLEREDSPWYPSMRLFRQCRLGDWSDVFERMAAELRTLAQSTASEKKD